MNDQTIIKQKILAACIAEVQKTMDNLKAAMDDAQQQANDYGQPKDRYDSFRTQLLRKRDMFAQQLHKANEDMGLLKKINPKEIKTKVEFGVVVITDTQNLLIGAGIGKFIVDKKEFFSISVAVPVFKVLKDKKAGEIVVFNGRKIIIENIF
jgi:hypothetical protein